MSKFEKNATADELWDYCVKEYESTNPIVSKLISNFFKKLSQALGYLDREDRVLEIGCGAGESSRKILKLLQGNYFEVSEFDERYVQKLRQIDFPLKVSQESVYTLQRETDEFDCIVLLEVLEHLEDVHKALSEIFRVSSKYVIISVPNEPLWRILNFVRGKYITGFGNTPGHINHWSATGFRKLLSNYGEVLQVYTPTPWVIAVVRSKEQSR